DGSFGRVGPTLAKIVAGAEQGAPKVLCGNPDAVAACASVISHRIDVVSVEIRAADFPAFALNIRTENECAFGCANEQKKIAAFHESVFHAAESSGADWALLGSGVRRNDGAPLNGFQ